MPEIRAIIFDCYSTLIDVKTNEQKDEVYRTVARLLTYFGARINGRQLRTAYELGKEEYMRNNPEQYAEVDMEAVVRNVLQKEGLDSKYLAEYTCKLIRVLSREKLQLFPDTLAVLKEMRRNHYPLAIISDAQRVFSLEEYRILNISHYFSYVLLSTHYGFRKPDTRLFTMVCTLMQIPPPETVYIGNDIEKDVTGAHNAGMQTILLDRDREYTAESDPRPDFYAEDLWQAWRWIQDANA